MLKRIILKNCLFLIFNFKCIYLKIISLSPQGKAPRKVKSTNSQDLSYQIFPLSSFLDALPIMIFYSVLFIIFADAVADLKCPLNYSPCLGLK
jgi:hypothetical protein